jgi:hypothetical protein
MPQLHFYVPEELADKIRLEAQTANMSISRYIAELIKRNIAPEWPEGYFDEVVGGWCGEPLKRPNQGDFEQRETLESRRE